MKTPITYYGGKQQMVPIILGMIPSHKIYCEPFFGGGAVFFAKGPSFLEAINDKNDLIITFYKQCITNFEELQLRVITTLCSESEQKKAKYIYHHPDGYSDIDKAWAVWASTNMSIMATPDGNWKRDNGTGGSHAGVSLEAHRKNFTEKIQKRLSKVQISCCDMSIMATPDGNWKRDNGTGGSHAGVSLEAHRKNFTEKIQKRLSKVQISCCDALKVIMERDTNNTFFYLDPPYINCEQKHYRGYTAQDFDNLLSLLQTIKGKFLLSCFLTEKLLGYIDRNHWNYKVCDKRCMITAITSKPRRKKEVLVYNYTIEPDLFT